MQIIIAGAGKVGASIAEGLLREGHDITVIDNDSEAAARLSDILDINCVVADAKNASVLESAGVSGADLFVAATADDKTNMLSSLAAKKLGAGGVIARVRDPEFLQQMDFWRDAIGLSFVVNPDFECALAISRSLNFPTAAKVDTFSKGRVEIVEYKIKDDDMLVNFPVRNMHAKFGSNVLISFVERGEDVFIPNGELVFKAGDTIGITGTTSNIRKFCIAAKIYKKPVKNVLVIGGGKTAVYLARILGEQGIDVSIIEKQRSSCEYIAELLPKASIICGDATRSDVLLSNGLTTCDAFVALTGDDAANVIASMYAREMGAEKVIVKVNREHYSFILKNDGLDGIVIPKELVALQLTRYVRGVSASAGSSMESLYKIAGGRVEASEFRLAGASELTGIKLKDLKLKKGVLIASIVRQGANILPGGETELMPDDYVVVVSESGRLVDINDILE